MEILNIIKEHFNVIWPVLSILIAWLLPTPRFKQLGEKVGEQIPPKLAKILAERIKAFERGLETVSVNGDINLIDNKTLNKEIRKLNLDLGLKELE